MVHQPDDAALTVTLYRVPAPIQPAVRELLRRDGLTRQATNAQEHSIDRWQATEDHHAAAPRLAAELRSLAEGHMTALTAALLGAEVGTPQPFAFEIRGDSRDPDAAVVIIYVPELGLHFQGMDGQGAERIVVSDVWSAIEETIDREDLVAALYRITGKAWQQAITTIWAGSDPAGPATTR